MVVTSLSRSGFSHAAGFLATVILHCAVIWFVSRPVPPVALPQSQVIQISMVAPTIIPQDLPEPEKPKTKALAPDIPPAPKGMTQKDRIPEVKPLLKKPEPVKEAVQKPQKKIEQITSGAVQKTAIKKTAAITKPRPAAYFNNPPPVYPRQARLRRQQGTVMLDVRVKIDGLPKQIKITQSSGYHLLDKAALDAVWKWEFVPARQGQSFVEANVEVPITFRLN